MVRLTDRPDMTLDVYRGRKTTIQQQYNRVGLQGLSTLVTALPFIIVYTNRQLGSISKTGEQKQQDG